MRHNPRWRMKRTFFSKMENHSFPSFNHPFYPDGGHQQTFVDYGSVSTLNIDVDNDGHVLTTSKHRHYEKETGDRLVGAHLTLPLLAPCKNVFTDKNFPEQRYHTSFMCTDFKTSIVGQTSDFSRDHPDISLQSSIEFIEQELNCKPWDPECFCYSKKIQATHKRKREHLNPNFNLDRFCDLFISFPLSKQLGIMKERVHALPKGLCEAFQDIPPRLLFDLLDESFGQQKIEKFYFDILQGNTLAYCNIPGGQSDGILFYPSGPCLEELNTSVVRLNSTGIVLDDTRKLYGKPTLLPCNETVDVKGAIRQISAVSYEYGDMFVATRSRYSCSFFSSMISTTNDNPEITLNPIDNLDNENQAMSLTLSPFIPGEGVIAMETGEVFIWHLGKDIETRNVLSFAPEQKWPWYQCVYASHPRCILIANPVEADIMDLRASGPSSRNLFSVTSKQVSTLERISAIQRNPENTHHYVIATDQSLLIMDDRFIQHPVLKWRHHLQDPVTYIEIITSAVPGCEDTLIMASGWQHRETHCFQYKWGEYDMRYTFPLSGKHLVNPPVSTVSPWKVSSYDEWPLHVPTSILPISSVLDDRLANPLIGVCGIPVTIQGEKKGLTVLQMSSAGDLFYQPLIPNDKGKKRFDQDDPSSEEPRKVKNISDADLTFLTNWIDELMDNKHVKYNEWPLKSNMLETDCKALFKEMIWLEEGHQACILCNPSTSSSYVQEEHDDDDKEDVCPRCGIDVDYARQLWKFQKQNIPCSQGVKKEIQNVNLYLVKDADSYQDPLSKNLLRNWFSNTTPLPLDQGNINTEEQIETPTTTSDVNIQMENRNEDEATEETSRGESSQLSNKGIEKKTFESDKGQGVDSPRKESLEHPTLTPPKPLEPIQSTSKTGSTSPSKQVKRIKRKLNQSMGF